MLAKGRNAGRRTVFPIVMIAVFTVLVCAATAAAQQAVSKKVPVEKVFGAIFSPDGEHILAAIRDGKNQHLHLFSIDGSQHRQITSGKRFDLFPSFSLDGKEIAFCSATDFTRKLTGMHPDIYTIPTSGGDAKRLTSTKFSEWWPQYFPSGTELIFEGDGDIFRADLKTGLVERLTSTPAYDTFPTINPSDGSIVFWRARWYGHNSPIASEAHHYFSSYLLAGPAAMETSIGSEDLYRLESVVTSTRAGPLLLDGGVGRWRIWTAAQPNSPKLLAPFDPEYKDSLSIEGVEKQGIRLAYYPSFVPGGDRILFVSPNSSSGSTDSKNMDIFTVDIDSFETRRITRLMVNIREPRISPSGEQVLFLVDPKPYGHKYLCQLWLMGLDGSNPHQFVVSE